MPPSQCVGMVRHDQLPFVSTQQIRLRRPWIGHVQMNNRLAASRQVPGQSRTEGLRSNRPKRRNSGDVSPIQNRSEEHTSELQSQSNLVCRLLLEKKKKTTTRTN